MSLLSGAGALLAVSFSAAVVTLMSPEGEMKKYIKFISALVVLAAIAVPVASTLADLPRMIESIEETDFGGNVDAQFDAVALSKAQIEKSVAEQVAAKFGLDAAEIEVSAELDAADTSAIVITKISVGVPRGADGEKIKAFVDALFKNTTNVEVNKVEDG